MTTKEAKKQLEVCEKQIRDEYIELKKAAVIVGSSAADAAASKTRSNIFWPLMIALAGLFLMFASHPIWGLLLIVLGSYVTYTSFQAASDTQKKVENAQKTLNSAINNNQMI